MRAPDGLSGGDLRQLAQRARSMTAPDRPVGIIGASVSGDRVALVATVNARGIEEGLSARSMLDAALPAVCGRGGGKDDMAQGGGSAPEGLQAAFDAVRVHVAEVAGA
jgi:alanyl-tRNA synthetase